MGGVTGHVTPMGSPIVMGRVIPMLEGPTLTLVPGSPGFTMGVTSLQLSETASCAGLFESSPYLAIMIGTTAEDSLIRLRVG